MSNPLKFSEERHKNLKLAMNSLMGAFLWAKTEQGAGYWREVYDNLRKLDLEYAKYMMEKDT